MTKAEVIAEIANRTEIDKQKVGIIIETFFQVVKDKMAEGENIYVRGFGSFINKKRAQKIGRNISKKVSIVIPAHFVPNFKPAKEFEERIKNSEVLNSMLTQNQ
ncbi:MAG: integration host factor subunit beta [Cytophagales bacterium]|nr:integration host factor subunit beta [Cytophagales bacterium]MDW8385300.1 HU family DNA-binding protein [Flammeovirgaceae bacterium]